MSIEHQSESSEAAQRRLWSDRPDVRRTEDFWSAQSDWRRRHNDTCRGTAFNHTILKISFIHLDYFYSTSSVHYYSEALPTQHGYHVRVNATGNREWRVQGPCIVVLYFRFIGRKHRWKSRTGSLNGRLQWFPLPVCIITIIWLGFPNLLDFKTWRLVRDSNPRPFGQNAMNLPTSHHAPQDFTDTCLLSQSRWQTAVYLCAWQFNLL